jgi:hypothetical protein
MNQDVARSNDREVENFERALLLTSAWMLKEALQFNRTPKNLKCLPEFDAVIHESDSIKTVAFLTKILCTSKIRSPIPQTNPDVHYCMIQ